MIDDFNMIPENKKLSDFCEMNKFERLILTLFRIEGGAKKPPTSFSPVTFTNLGISPPKLSDF